MGKNKSYAVKDLANRIYGRKGSKSVIRNEIRTLSDNDESFENVVFELGCSALAKAYVKEFGKGE